MIHIQCTCIYIYIYIYMCMYMYADSAAGAGLAQRRGGEHGRRLLYYSTLEYTRSPLEDSRLFGPSPWKILASTKENHISEQPSPWRKSSKRESCYGDRVYTILSYTIHYALYTLYTLHSTLYTIHYTLYTIHYTLYHTRRLPLGRERDAHRGRARPPGDGHTH